MIAESNCEFIPYIYNSRVWHLITAALNNDGAWTLGVWGEKKQNKNREATGLEVEEGQVVIPKKNGRKIQSVSLVFQHCRKLSKKDAVYETAWRWHGCLNVSSQVKVRWRSVLMSFDHCVLLWRIHKCEIFCSMSVCLSLCLSANFNLACKLTTFIR